MDDCGAKLFQLRHEIDSQGVAIFRIPAEAVGELDKTLEVFLFGMPKIINLFVPFELTGIDNADRNNNHILKMIRK